jgi:hypothetical protein
VSLIQDEKIIIFGEQGGEDGLGPGKVVADEGVMDVLAGWDTSTAGGDD